MLDRPFMMEERIKKMLDEELVKALKALAGYKFYMAGYHAASWVKLNKLLDNPLHNPFREYVEIARSRLIEVPDE